MEGVEAVTGLGSIRKILTANHAIWLRTDEAEATYVYKEATKQGYRVTVLAHDSTSKSVWLQLGKGKACEHATHLKSRWWSRIQTAQGEVAWEDLYAHYF